jgi:hypothetical protein
VIPRPELLTSPLLPQSLYRLSPRTIFGGDKWWNEQRKLAYEKTNFLCSVCGTHKDDRQCACGKHFAYKKYLEAHEIYSIDYDNFVVELVEVAALCHSCHNFIHSGRLVKDFADGINSRSYTSNVLEHGIEILTRSNLKPLATQALAYLQVVKGFSTEDALSYIIEKQLEVEKRNIENIYVWKIRIEGRLYG